MAINNVEKIYIFAPRQDREKLLEELQKAAVFHIEKNLKAEIEEDTKEKEILSQEIELSISQAEYVIDYLKKYEKKTTFAQKLEKAGSVIDYGEFSQIANRFSLKSVYDEVYRLFKSSKELQAEENELKSKLARMEPYKNLIISFNKIKDTANVKMRLGTLGEAQFKKFHMELEELGKVYTLFKIAEGLQQRDYFYLAYHRSIAAEVEKHLTRHNFRDEDLKVEGTIGEEIKKTESRLEEIQKEKKGIVEESILLADWLDKVKLVYDYLLSVRDRKKTENFIYETRSVFILKGWVKRQDLKKLEEIVSSAVSCYEIHSEKPDKTDSVPVEMVNPTFISPMEFVTSLYGTPKYNEYDPTGYIFGFFLLFFGICLTDAGYGVMLLILSLVLLKYMGDSKLLRVLLYGSVITIIAGFVAGGFFGIPYNDLPAFIQKYSINISEKALQFLGFTLFLGIAQLVYGMILGARLALKNKNIDGFLDLGIKAVFFGCGAPIAVMGGLLNTSFPEPWNGILTKITLTAGAAFLIVQFVRTFSEFKNEGTFAEKAISFVSVFIKAAVTESVLALVNAITGFLGAMLSYSRLMALGLSTGGIGMVVNLLAGLVKDLIPVPVLGSVISIVILVFGHIFNLVISTLGAFVHTARLQYVEFFPNFFEGGGRRFEPFAIRTKYNTVATKS